MQHMKAVNQENFLPLKPSLRFCLPRLLLFSFFRQSSEISSKICSELKKKNMFEFSSVCQCSLFSLKLERRCGITLSEHAGIIRVCKAIASLKAKFVLQLEVELKMCWDLRFDVEGQKRERQKWPDQQRRVADKGAPRG